MASIVLVAVTEPAAAGVANCAFRGGASGLGRAIAPAASLPSVVSRTVRLSLLTLLCGGALLIAGCGDSQGDGDSTAPSGGEGTAAAGETTAGAPGDAGDPGDPGDSPGDERPDREGVGGGSGRPTDAEREAVGERAQAAYRDYIDAINARDGATLCDLLSPASVRKLKPPVERSSCAATLRASIGYSDPRGLPVWKRTLLNGIDGTQVAASLASARITAAIVTEFADRDEPSVESDIAYLKRVGGRWRLAKPSGAIYRAIGVEPPPDVIVPPRG